MTYLQDGPAGQDWRSSATAALWEHATYNLQGRSALLVNETIDAFADRFSQENTGFVAILLPADVYLGMTGEAPPPQLLAAFSAAYLSIRVIDDIMDGDAPRFVGNREPAEVLLVSQLLFGCAGQLMALADRDLTQQRGQILDRYRRTIAAMIEGQLVDEQPLTSQTSPADVNRKIELKSGAMLAGFCEIASVAAGADTTMIANASDLGLHLAIARQHQNDLADLANEQSLDLRDSKATMALALVMSRLEPDEKTSYEALVRSVEGDHDSIAALVDSNLIAAVKDVIVLSELHLQAAGRALAAIESAHSQCGLARWFIDAASLTNK